MRFALPLLPALLLALALLPGCATSETTPAAAGIDTEGDLVEYLNARGYILRPAGTRAPLVLGEPGQVYEVSTTGGALAIYEFASAQAAARGANAFQVGTFGSQATLYRRGTLLVAFSGGDTSLELTLQQILGPSTY